MYLSDCYIAHLALLLCLCFTTWLTLASHVSLAPHRVRSVPHGLEHAPPPAYYIFHLRHLSTEHTTTAGAKYIFIDESNIPVSPSTREVLYCSMCLAVHMIDLQPSPPPYVEGHLLLHPSSWSCCGGLILVEGSSKPRLPPTMKKRELRFRAGSDVAALDHVLTSNPWPQLPVSGKESNSISPSKFGTFEIKACWNFERAAQRHRLGLLKL